jgi:hypothetical protein
LSFKVTLNAFETNVVPSVVLSSTY